ncbi:MAG: hypothetical protein ABI577_06670 [bacterium]
MTTAVAQRTAFYRVHPGARFSTKRWFALVLPGESAGFVLPGLAWFVVWALSVPPLVASTAVVLSGAGEGAMLGFAQWLALRHWDTTFPRRWIAVTAASASLAWACGMTPSTASDLGAPVWLIIPLALVLMTVLLASMPVAQYLVLRRYVPRAWRWIPWSIAAWLLALPPTFLIPMSIPNDSPVAAFAIGWVVSGLLMASILAFVTGKAMQRLLDGATVDPRLRPGIRHSIYRPWLKSANEK